MSFRARASSCASFFLRLSASSCARRSSFAGCGNSKSNSFRFIMLAARRQNHGSQSPGTFPGSAVSSSAGAARNHMFESSLVNDKARTARPYTVSLSLMLQITAAAAAVAYPLWHIEALKVIPLRAPSPFQRAVELVERV